ncbi:hypothetical protein D3C80_1462890 [compost metagenome]
MQGQTLAFEVFNALGLGTGRYHQIDVVAAASGHDQFTRHATCTSDHRGQIAAHGKVDAVVAEAFVDLRTGASVGQSDPLKFHAALTQLLFEPSVFDNASGNTAKHRFAALGVGDDGDLHRRRSLFGQCGGTEQ